MCPEDSWVTDVMVQNDEAGDMGLIGFGFYCRDEFYQFTGAYTQVKGYSNGVPGEWKPWLAKEQYPLYVDGMMTCDDMQGDNWRGVVDLYIQ